MAQQERVGFGSKLGIILATAGGAVGLGNVWRFPYMCGENGGAVFIFIYIGCVLLLGLPCMVSEFIIGRHAASNAARAFTKMSGGTAWKWVGYLGVLTAFLINGYYVVVSGWCLQYLFSAATNSMHGDTAYFANFFTEFSGSAWQPVIWIVAIIAVSHYVIIHGVRNGIERASKIFMPVLFILLLIIVVAACMLPGAGKGIAFIFKPDFSKVTSDVFLSALGQSFYSMSIAMGAICTYASYYSRQTNLGKSAIQIGTIDTVIAILAGLMIFPAAFSVGVSPDSGPSLIFITLPNVFEQAFGAMPLVGYVVSLLFYALLSLAALTSLMSLHEVLTAFFQEELHVSRTCGATIMSVACIVMGTLCSLSLGATDKLTFGDMTLFSIFDFVTGQVFLPIGGLLTCLFIGWYVPRKVVSDEFTNWGTLRGSLFGMWYFLVRFICPLAIIAIFLHQFNIL